MALRSSDAPFPLLCPSKRQLVGAAGDGPARRVPEARGSRRVGAARSVARALAQKEKQKAQKCAVKRCFMCYKDRNKDFFSYMNS